MRLQTQGLNQVLVQRGVPLGAPRPKRIPHLLWRFLVLCGQTQIKPLRIGVRRFAGQAWQITTESAQKAGFASAFIACHGYEARA